MRIQFFQQSFKVVSPVITPMVFFLKRDIDARDKKQIREFIGRLVHDSIALGREDAQAEMRVALGIGK